MTRRIDAASARETRSCESCGQIFEPARTDALFCSAACRQRAYRRRCGVTDNSGAALRIFPVGGSLMDNPGVADETGARVTDNSGAGAETGPPLRLIESRRGPGRCAQCSDLRDGTETEFIIHGARVLLHKECVPYYIKLHDQFHVSRWDRD
jgi:hypothetical protein